MAEIKPILYSREVQKLIFPDNSFYKHSVQEKGIADNVTAVVKPVQLKIRKAKSDEPESLPLKVYKPKDSTTTYEANLLYAEPILVDDPSEFALNYNKRSLKQQQQADEINTRAATIAVINWAPTKPANILKATGGARATNVVGLTGTRRSITKDDMLAVHNLMLRMSAAAGQWRGLVTADGYTDLLKVPEFVDFYKTGNASALQNGIVGRILGIDIYIRTVEEMHTGLLYNAGGGKKSIDAEIEATDQPACLFWNDKLVCSAEGKLRTSVNADQATYLGGTIISSWTRFGADIIREDQRGVIALLEAK